MYEENSSQSKKISFQSIFSSLCNLYQHITPAEDLVGELKQMAFDINDELHKKYPVEVKTQTTMQPTQQGAKQKPRRCPKCGSMSYYNNKGISKAGNPYENNKCSKCKHIEWLSDNYYSAEAKAKAQAQDDIDDQANNQIPPEYQ